jgi:hypothetical protein
LVLETIKARQDPFPAEPEQQRLLKDSLDLFIRLLRYNDARLLKFEGIWLIFQTLIIVFLAFQLNDPYNFFTVYGILLLSNSIWLILTNVVVAPTITQINQEVFYFHPRDESFFGRFPRLAAWRWAINNVVHCSGLCLVVYLSHRSLAVVVPDPHSPSLLIWGYGLCISNCIADFVLTRDFYFPKFMYFYKAYEDAITAAPVAPKSELPAERAS